MDGPSPLAMACPFSNRLIAVQCCMVLAWSRMLLVRSELAPTIHLSLKFLELSIRSLNLQHTEHRSHYCLLADACLSYAVQPCEGFEFFIKVSQPLLKCVKLNSAISSSFFIIFIVVIIIVSTIVRGM